MNPSSTQLTPGTQHPQSSNPHRASCIALLLVALLLAACSSVKTHVDKEPVKARTFSFLDTGTRQAPGYAEDRAQAHAMVQSAIRTNLAARGVSYAPSGGDVTVAYLIVVGNNSTTTSLNQYFGYTDDASAFVEKAHSEETGSEAHRGYYEAGTLVIDFLHPSDSKLLQRRTIQAQVLRNLPAETRAARVQSIVDQALHDVPIQP